MAIRSGGPAGAAACARLATTRSAVQAGPAPVPATMADRRDSARRDRPSAMAAREEDEGCSMRRELPDSRVGRSVSRVRHALSRADSCLVARARPPICSADGRPPSHAHFPTPLSDYPPASPAGLLQTLTDRIAQDPANIVATGIFALAILHTFLAPRVPRAGARRPAPRRSRRRCRGQATATRVPVGDSPLRGRGGGGLRPVGGGPACRGHVGSRVDADQALRQRHGQLHRTPVRRRHHGPGLDAADHRPGRAGDGQGGGARRQHAGGLVVRDADDRSPARLVHHRAGRDDHLRAAALAAVLRPRSEPAPQVRHAGPAVRERLDRRHADPLRRTTHPDGGAARGDGT